MKYIISFIQPISPALFPAAMRSLPSNSTYAHNRKASTQSPTCTTSSSSSKSPLKEGSQGLNGRGVLPADVDTGFVRTAKATQLNAIKEDLEVEAQLLKV